MTGMLPPVKSTKTAARAFAEALFLREGGPAPSDRIDWLIDEFVDFLQQAGPRSRLILEGGLFCSAWLAPVLIRRRPPLARLPLDERCQALEAFENTPAGLALLSVKAIFSILYYEHEDSADEIGVDAHCLEEAR